MHAHAQACPSFGRSVHVDDIIRDFQGTHDVDVVHQVIDSNRPVQRHFTELGMRLAREEGQFVASAEPLAKAVSRASLGKGRTAEPTVCRLGCDYAVNQVAGQAHLVHRNRILKTRKRLTHMVQRFKNRTPGSSFLQGSGRRPPGPRPEPPRPMSIQPNDDKWPRARDILLPLPVPVRPSSKLGTRKRRQAGPEHRLSQLLPTPLHFAKEHQSPWEPRRSSTWAHRQRVAWIMSA
jgi:hypothetical protein